MPQRLWNPQTELAWEHVKVLTHTLGVIVGVRRRWHLLWDEKWLRVNIELCFHTSKWQCLITGLSSIWKLEFDLITLRCQCKLMIEYNGTHCLASKLGILTRCLQWMTRRVPQVLLKLSNQVLLELSNQVLLELLNQVSKQWKRIQKGKPEEMTLTKWWKHNV